MDGSGAKLMRRGPPSSKAARDSAMTMDWEQAPPIQPVIPPPCRMTALNPGFPDVGRTARTTVARTKGSPRPRSSSASSNGSSAIDRPK